MTLDKIYTLEDVIEEALSSTNSAPTPEVRQWIQRNRRRVLEENRLTIEAPGLDYWIRQYRKKRPSAEEALSIHQLCMDFGLEDLDLDTEISVPVDEADILYGACEWRELDDATVRDLDLHISLLEATIAATQARLKSCRILRQVAIRIARGKLDIPIRELRLRAKK